MGIFRPDLTTHAGMIEELRRLLNRDAVYPLSATDVCKIAVEKMFKNAHPEKVIVRMPRKMYIPLKH
jgi:hypothetical protein